MSESEVYEWLQNYQIPTPEYKVFTLTEDPVVNFYPAALKISSPRIVHKSDVGGVVINLENREDLRQARASILAGLKSHGIEPDENDRLIATRMYTGIELFFGIVNDPVFEKVIVFGAGGTFVELFKDVCYVDSEADETEIRNAIGQTKIAALFTKGFRGKKYDITLVIDLIQKLQRLDVKELDLNPVILTEKGLTVVDARILRESVSRVPRPLKFIPGIFCPEKVAIIGVSEHIQKVGYALAKNTSDLPDVYYVNPRLDTLLGKRVYKNIAELPAVDTAVLSIPAGSIPDAIEQLAVKGVRNVVIISAGFKEDGKDEGFLADLAQKHGLNIVGPNCLGIYTNHKNLTFGTDHIQPGPLNLFSQSGAIMAELMDKAVLKNRGFEHIVSVGNMADVDFADLIHSYQGTHPINLYVEGVAHGKNLLRAIRESSSRIKVFKAGKSEAAQRTAFSHTGNLAGNHALFTGLLRNIGVRMLDNVNGLLSPYHFEKVLVITNAGGSGTVMSDLVADKLYELSQEQIDELGAVLPSNWSKNNPIDIIGEATHERYLKTLRVVDGFEADAIFVLVTPQFMTDPEKISAIFTQNSFKTKIFPVLLGGEMMESAKICLRENRIEFFEELNEAVAIL